MRARLRAHQAGTRAVLALTVASVAMAPVTLVSLSSCAGRTPLAEELGEGEDAGQEESPSDFIDIALGSWHSCVLDQASTIYCWGSNQAGQLGDPALQAPGSFGGLGPVVVGGITDPVEISAGSAKTCARTANDEVQCWGGGINSPRETTLLPGVGAISVGSDHICALIDDGQVRCWGENAYGQLGDGTLAAATAAEPTTVAGLEDAVALASGQHFSCAVKATGFVACWGRNDVGQLGDGTLNDHAMPAPVRNFRNATSLSAIDRHACARSFDGLYCWGNNEYGELGDPSMQYANPIPFHVPLPNVIEVGAGRDHTCALDGEQRPYCWGRGSRGETGSQAAGAEIPDPVDEIIRAARIAVGARHTCVISLEPRGIYCWGDDLYDQVGPRTDAPMFNNAIPWEVRFNAPQ